MANWYTVTLEDKGSGMNKQSFYMEADSVEEVEDRIEDVARNDMSPEPIRVDESDKTPSQMVNSVMRGGYNVAYRSDGTEVRKKDVMGADPEEREELFR